MRSSQVSTYPQSENINYQDIFGSDSDATDEEGQNVENDFSLVSLDESDTEYEFGLPTAALPSDYSSITMPETKDYIPLPQMDLDDFELDTVSTSSEDSESISAEDSEGEIFNQHISAFDQLFVEMSAFETDMEATYIFYRSISNNHFLQAEEFFRDTKYQKAIEEYNLAAEFLDYVDRSAYEINDYRLLELYARKLSRVYHQLGDWSSEFEYLQAAFFVLTQAEISHGQTHEGEYWLAKYRFHSALCCKKIENMQAHVVDYCIEDAIGRLEDMQDEFFLDDNDYELWAQCLIHKGQPDFALEMLQQIDEDNKTDEVNRLVAECKGAIANDLIDAKHPRALKRAGKMYLSAIKDLAKIEFKARNDADWERFDEYSEGIKDVFKAFVELYTPAQTVVECVVPVPSDDVMQPLLANNRNRLFSSPANPYFQPVSPQAQDTFFDEPNDANGAPNDYPLIGYHRI